MAKNRQGHKEVRRQIYSFVAMAAALASASMPRRGRISRPKRPAGITRGEYMAKMNTPRTTTDYKLMRRSVEKRERKKMAQLSAKVPNISTQKIFINGIETAIIAGPLE